MIDAIEAHYDAFPYPKARRIVRPFSPAHTAGTLSHLLRRRALDAMPSAPRVWVAGCGTQQGTSWALAFPEGDVLATDVSAVTLERAKALANHLGVRTRFERHDLATPLDESGFDLVVSTGVVHHLASPGAGLRSIRAALAPNGAASIMVYSRVHRAPLEPVRYAATMLAKEAPDPYACAVLVLGQVLSGNTGPLDRDLLASLAAMRETDPSFVADVLLNPREATYDVEELMALFGESGLRFVEWLYPASWQLGLYSADAELGRQVARLEPMQRAAFIQRFAGLTGPLLEVLVERDDAPVRPPYAREERLAMPMMRNTGGVEIHIEGTSAREGQRFSPYERSGDMVTGTIRSNTLPGRTWALGASTLPFLEAFDGKTTVATIASAFAKEIDTDAVLALVETLGPREVGLLAPAWSATSLP